MREKFLGGGKSASFCPFGGSFKQSNRNSTGSEKISEIQKERGVKNFGIQRTLGVEHLGISEGKV